MSEPVQNDSRTKRRLRKAYAEILATKSYENVTVQELVNAAELSRTAFYTYFQGMDEFREELTEYFAEKISMQMSAWLEDGRKNMENGCKKKNLVFDENDRNLFSLYYKQRRNAIDYRKCFTVAKESAIAVISKKAPEFSEIAKNDSGFDFFLRGFCFCTCELLADYSSVQAEKELNFAFEIADSLFPENNSYTK